MIKLSDSQMTNEINTKRNRVARPIQCCKSPALDMKKQAWIIINKSNNISHLISSYGLSMCMVRWAYYTWYSPIVKHPLPDTHISKDAFDAMHTLVITRLLQAMAYNQHFPMEVVLVSKAMSDMELHHLYTTHIMYIVKCVCTGTTICKLYLTDIQTTQMWVGTCFEIFVRWGKEIPEMSSR